MGGKLTSPRCGSAHTGRGAVVFENNYALREEECEAPVYVMGYVNTFAVEKYESNDIAEGLPSETYEEDEVFTSTTKHPTESVQSPCDHTHNTNYVLIDGQVLNLPSDQPAQSDKTSQEESLVFMNNVLNSNNATDYQCNFYNNNVPISDSNHYALMLEKHHGTVLHEDISNLNINSDEFQTVNQRST